MRSNTNREFYIVDFTASSKYFHQYPLIIGISNFLIKKGFTPKILLPVIADRVDIEHASKSVNFILDSGYSNFRYKPLRHLIGKILPITTNGRFLGRSIKKFLRRKYVNSSLKYFREIKSCESIHVIFPTLDPLSLELAVQLSKSTKMGKYFFYFRIIGIESRGILSSHYELDVLQKLVKNYPEKIRIGIETIGYQTYLENLGFDSSVIYWSPWPCLENFDKAKSKNKRFTIGFLGCAKRRKGFDNIPNILNRLNAAGVDFDVLIQESNFPWSGYDETKNKVLNLGFEFLSSDLDLASLQQYINKCDLMILPYDTDSYSINGSGVLYHACDSSIPTITATGVGFAPEIADFTLGLTYTSLDEIPDLVKKIQLMKFNFKNYNLKRNEATIQFLLK